MRRRKTKERKNDDSSEDEDRLSDSPVSKEIKTSLSQLLRLAEEDGE